MFSTVMNERHNAKMGVFGGKPGQQMEFKGKINDSKARKERLTCTVSGMAGNQVLEWADLDTEIKTADLKNVRVAFSFNHASCAC